MVTVWICMSSKCKIHNGDMKTMKLQGQGNLNSNFTYGYGSKLVITISGGITIHILRYHQSTRVLTHIFFVCVYMYCPRIWVGPHQALFLVFRFRAWLRKWRSTSAKVAGAGTAMEWPGAWTWCGAGTASFGRRGRHRMWKMVQSILSKKIIKHVPRYVQTWPINTPINVIGTHMTLIWIW